MKDGDTLRLCNLDLFFHKSFSISPGNKFSMTIKPGDCQTFKVRNPTDNPIRLALFDDLHSYEKLLLEVMPGGANSAENPPDQGKEPPAPAAAWRRVLGRWKNVKGPLVLDITESGLGFEGRVVKPGPNWPASIQPGAVYLRGKGAAEGNTLDVQIRTFPQGSDCPNLLPGSYQPSRLDIDQTGDRMTVHQTGRYYDPGSCEWSEKTFEETATWIRVK